MIVAFTMEGRNCGKTARRKQEAAGLAAAMISTWTLARAEHIDGRRRTVTIGPDGAYDAFDGRKYHIDPKSGKLRSRRPPQRAGAKDGGAQP